MSSVPSAPAAIESAGDHQHQHDHQHHQNAAGTVCCELHNTANAESGIVFALVGGALVLTTVFGRFLGIVDEIRQIPAAVGAILLWIPLLQGAYREIKNARPSSATLVAIAIGAAVATSEFATAGGLAFILLLMDRVLQRTARGAHQAIEQLVQLTPDVARRISDTGDETMVGIEELKIGDRVRVLPGENLPADGTVVQGRTAIRQSSLTGESAPVEIEVGSPVYAATTNLTGAIVVEVTKVGAQTAIGKVVTLIDEAEHSKTPRQQIIEMVSGPYVWVILMVALAVWILSDKSGAATGSTSAVERAISVLIVTCPGAFLLASPTAMVASFASAARLGVMIKSTATLEAAAKIDSVVLDKTGTVTTGDFAVSRLAPADGVEAADLLAAAATAEQHSDHPLAKAILATAKKARVTPAPTDESEEVHGLGVKVRVDNGMLYVGRAKWVVETNTSIASAADQVETKLEGMSSVHVVLNDRYLGAIGLEDSVRPEAVDTIRQLRGTGVRHITLLTGDRWPVARRVAEAIGVDHVEAECHPEEKHAYIESLIKHGHRVMMVGDGINDGPSLAAADVGVAMGMGGTDVAANSAGIALMTDDLSRLAFLIKLAKKSRVVVMENILVAILIAILGVSLAVGGHIFVLAAAAYHFASDIFVIGNSFRLVRFGEELGSTAEIEDDSATASERRAWATAKVSTA